VAAAAGTGGAWTSMQADGGQGWRRRRQGRGHLSVGGGRRLSGPAGDGDEGAEGRPAQAAALGAKAAAATAWNKKSSQSRSELCGTWGERSSALV
jgi:hypothetical protein